MNFQKASEADFCTIQKFYWDVIDNIHKNNTENKTDRLCPANLLHSKQIRRAQSVGFPDF